MPTPEPRSCPGVSNSTRIRFHGCLNPDSPGVRYLAMRDLVDGAKPADLQRARTAAHKRGPIAEILGHMHKDGYWVKPGPGYSPKYRSTVWSIITLAQLGASIEEDARVAKACNYMLDQMAEGGTVLNPELPAPLRAPSTACRGTCAGRCSIWAATIRGSTSPSTGWRAR